MGLQDMFRRIVSSRLLSKLVLLILIISSGSYECSSENMLSSGRVVRTPAYQKILRVEDVAVVSGIQTQGYILYSRIWCIHITQV